MTQAANDKQQMVPLIEAIQEQSGQRPKEVLTDSGYCSEENLKYLAKRRMAGFVATAKQKHGERNEPCKRGPIPKDASRVERMQRKLKTKVGSAVYARRKCMVEPVFGQIKQARGFRQFLLRGLKKVRGEWALICMTHNLLKFHQDLLRVKRGRTKRRWKAERNAPQNANHRGASIIRRRPLYWIGQHG